jgi:hypothetical protein
MEPPKPAPAARSRPEPARPITRTARRLPRGFYRIALVGLAAAALGLLAILLFST